MLNSFNTVFVKTEVGVTVILWCGAGVYTCRHYVFIYENAHMAIDKNYNIAYCTGFLGQKSNTDTIDVTGFLFWEGTGPLGHTLLIKRGEQITLHTVCLCGMQQPRLKWYKNTLTHSFLMLHFSFDLGVLAVTIAFSCQFCHTGMVWLFFPLPLLPAAAPIFPFWLKSFWWKILGLLFTWDVILICSGVYMHRHISW